MTDENQDLSEADAKRMLAQALPNLYRVFGTVEMRLGESLAVVEDPRDR